MEAVIAAPSNNFDSKGNVISLAEVRQKPLPVDVKFERRELDCLLRIYSFMVAGGDWRDYGISHTPQKAVFAVFRRTSEMPLYRIEKDPKLNRKQAMFSVITPAGQIIKRGNDLNQVLKVFDKSIRLVQSDER